MTTPTIYRTDESLSLSAPQGICVNPDLGRVVICDYTNDKLVECNINGLKHIRDIDTYYARTIDSNIESHTTVSINNPTGICYSGGYYFVSDGNNHVVVMFNQNFEYVNHFGTIGTSGSTNALLYLPGALCSDGYYLYVCDKSNNRIMKIKIEDMSYVSKTSNINGALAAPDGIAFQADLDGSLFVSDTTNTRVIKCDTEFTYISQNSASVGTPFGLAVSGDLVYVCNVTDDEITVLSTEDLTEITTLQDATIDIPRPYGIATWRNALFITDNTDNKVTVWRTYIPRDSVDNTDEATFGLQDLVFGVDEPILDTAGEYGDQNRWVEPPSHPRSIDWVES